MEGRLRSAELLAVLGMATDLGLGLPMADFAEQKSAFFAGQSAQVAELATRAGERLGLGGGELATLRFAALARDLGRVAISAAIWDKPGPLNDAEWESVRLHPYYSERMLVKVPTLADAAALAGAHLERCDGSGYHRGSRAQPAASCLLAAADAYVTMRHARAYRPAFGPGRKCGRWRVRAGWSRRRSTRCSPRRVTPGRGSAVSGLRA